MFLTRVLVEKYDVVRFGLRDRYDWHQAIWRAFPGRESGTKQPFLWRLDVELGASTLWICSETEPERLAWGRQATKTVAETFLTHAKYQFALSANPTVKRVVRDEDGNRKRNGARHAVFNAEELRNWLVRKGEAGGFRVERCDIDQPIRESFYREDKETGKMRHGTLSRVEFRGVLAPTDFELFEAAWKNGIGTAKGMGFGLLLLKPVA